MKIAVIGGGVLGLSQAYYLQKRGHEVEVFERNRYLGGLASSYDYGDFVWDRFYHVILPHDGHLLELVRELGLGEDLRWRRTQTGFYAGKTFYPMSSTWEMLRFPLLSWPDKFRMGVATMFALRLARPADLHRISAADWLTKVFGARNYTRFWRPLLRAKFGAYAEQVAAIAIHAALQRLFGARSAVENRESMGYVHGGYDRILAALKQRLESRGVRIHLDARIQRIGLAHEFAPEAAMAVAVQAPGTGRAPRARSLPYAAEPASGGSSGCGIQYATRAGLSETSCYDKVIFTAPRQFAWPILTGSLKIMSGGNGNGTAGHTPQRYLGVVCLNVVLRRPLTPYYILNIADDGIPLTGMIEMTGLIDRAEETRGLSLVYLPRYVDSEDPFLKANDSAIYEELFTRGLKTLFPDLTADAVVSWHVQRAQHVQPLQLVTDAPPQLTNRLPDMRSPFMFVNTACLANPTLNNNEVVGLAKEAAEKL